MGCRDVVLLAANEIVRRRGINQFSLQEIVDHIMHSGSYYKESTIRTHVTSRMCRNSPKHHAVKYSDFERIGHGKYRLVKNPL